MRSFRIESFCIATGMLVSLLAAGCGEGENTSGGGGEGGGTPLPEPVATMAELIVPFDANRQDLEGPGGWSTQYGKSPEIIPIARGRVIDVLVQEYENNQPKSRALLLRLQPREEDYVITGVLEPPMLDRVMGLGVDGETVFIASGVDETDTLTLEDPAPGEYRSGIVRVVKQTWDGAVLFDTDLDLARQAAGGSPELLINPMVAATSRMAVGGGRVALVHGINTDADFNINARHQKAITTHLDAETGQVTRTSSAWVSHSFDQRVFHDGTSFIELHLGDAYPRDIVLASVEPDVTAYSALAIKGDLGANNTFTRLGNAAMIQGDPDFGYLVLFATEAGPATSGMITASRDLGLVRARRDLPSLPKGTPALDTGMPDVLDVQSVGEQKQNPLRWLTHYQADTGGQSHAERPKLVPLGGDKYVVLWERWDSGGGKFAGTWGMVIDATGAPVIEAKQITDSHLPRGDDAFPLDGDAAWITGDSELKQLQVHIVTADLAYRRILVE
ncbi:MAG: hypothetical protein R3B70_36140 [Polyangiaceae bacterium]